MLKYWVWLAELPRLKGPFRLALLRHFGSPEDIFFADREELLLAEDVPPGQDGQEGFGHDLVLAHHGLFHFVDHLSGQMNFAHKLIHFLG